MAETTNFLILIKGKETKHTRRYEELSDNPIVGTIYIKKFAVKDLGLGDRIKVTIEALD